ncbi:MAG: dihydrofolate reductase [Bacteriovoracaceae bacterium]|nr:dihydrofolate reductase [Bacteriovoracaceae bacterium]
MSEIEYILIAAVDLGGVMGLSGTLPWHIPSDFKHFKKTTEGHPMIMGRKTCESLKGALPNRDNLVLSRNTTHQKDGFLFFSSQKSIEDWAVQNKKNKIFVVGGAEIYSLYLAVATSILISRIETKVVGGDTYFPEFASPPWHLEEKIKNEPGAQEEFPWHLEIWKK